MKAALYLVVFFIIYGSLYPFDFNISTLDPNDFRKLFDFRIWQSSLSDLLSNILLFVPYGILLWSLKHNAQKKSFFVDLSICFLVAYVIQVLQIFIPKRIPYGADAIWNLFGFFIGIGLAKVFGDKLRIIQQKQSQILSFQLLLALGFVVYQLRPFVPTMDWGLIKINLKNVVSFANFELSAAVYQFVFLLIPLLLLRNSLPVFLSFGRILSFFLILLCLQMLLLDGSGGVNSLLGSLLLLVVWQLFSERLVKISNIHVFFLLLASITYFGFSSFELREIPRDFNWLPFSPALEGSMPINLSALLGKGLLYTACLWFAYAASLNLRIISALLAAYVFIIEYLQRFFEAATPDITDSLIILIAGILMPKLVRAPNSKMVSYDAVDKTGIGGTLNPPSVNLKNYKGLIVVFLVLTFGQVLVMSLPNIPYNIKELYGENDTFLNYFFLSLTVVIFVIGQVWISKRLSEQSVSLVKAPLFCLALSAITLFFLRLAVTDESISDINGSSNIVYQLTGEKILGEAGSNLVQFLGEDNARGVSRLVEPFVRFAALTGPLGFLIVLVTSTCLANLPLHSLQGLRQHSLLFLKQFMYFLPWFFVCKVTTFDYSSTDNLNELIAPPQQFGLGGGGYLYLLFFSLVSSAVICAWTLYNHKKLLFVAIVAVCLLVPINWFLLNAGLVTDFTKYGHTYSGVDFLLGPDRSDLLTEYQLFKRWLLVNLVFVLGLSALFYSGLSALNVKGAITEIPTGMTKRWPLKKLGLGAAAIVGVITTYPYLQQILFASTSNPIKSDWAHLPANFIFDHHTHTKLSDGALTLEELSRLAQLHGCNGFAVTDHTNYKRSLTKKKLNTIRKLRKEYPELLVFAGAEANPPPYQGREHVAIIATPNYEAELYDKLKDLEKEASKSTSDGNQYFAELTKLKKGAGDIIAIYNHPSRKDLKGSENRADLETWDKNNDIFVGLSGAPGHQKASIFGSYNTMFVTIDRWDPAIASVNATWDQLLDSGKQYWGAISSSDFHNHNLDYSPCEFSRIHISTPEKTYDGVLKALRYGTFWSDHGRILKQYRFFAEVEGETDYIYAGQQTSKTELGELISLHFEVQRDIASVGLPLTIEVITNCIDGTPTQLEPVHVKPFNSSARIFMPLEAVGKDDGSCYARSRIRVKTTNDDSFLAYSNHIRFLFD